MTQLFFESAEPLFDEIDPADFFLPSLKAGTRSQDACRREPRSRAHRRPLVTCSPRRRRTSGSRGFRPQKTVTSPSLPVVGRASHRPLGPCQPVPSGTGQARANQGQQVSADRGGRGNCLGLSLDLPPTVTEFQIPVGVTDLADEFKFEIIVRTTAGKHTAIESCFVVQ